MTEVFLSYARSASRDHALAVHRALGGEEAGVAFLDSAEIEHGGRFPQRLVDALLASRVQVIFAEPAYFTRWYCNLELEAALAPYRLRLQDPRCGPDERAAALDSIVVALPVGGPGAREQWRLPPDLQGRNWPAVADAVAITDLVRARLVLRPPTLGQRLDAAGGAEPFRRQWLDEARLPPPLSLPADTPTVPLVGLPPSLGDAFVGRADDLWLLCDTLAAGRHGAAGAAPLTASLEGGAGAGKSRLAVEYLHRFGPRHHPGGLFWIDAEQSLELQHRAVLEALDPTQHRGPGSAAGAVAADSSAGGAVAGLLVRAFRSLPPDRPALVVVDNVPEPHGSDPPSPLTTWFSAAGEVALLVTSRHRLSLGTDGVVGLRLEPLDTGPAVAVLSRHLDLAVVADEAWEELVAWVGGLPFALQLLNGALRAGAFGVDELLGKARSGRSTLDLDEAAEALRGQVPAGQLRALSASLEVSYTALPDLARRAAHLVAWLAPAPVPEALTGALAGVPRAAWATLRARSFVGEVWGGPVPVYGAMHRVLADYLRAQSSDPAGELALVARALCEVMGPRLTVTTEWPLAAACEPHASALLHQLVAGGATLEDETLASLVELVGGWYMTQGAIDAAADLMLGMLIGATDEAGENRDPLTISPGLFPFMRQLARILAARGDPSSAEVLYRLNIEYLQRRVGAEDPVLLEEQDNLADALRARGSSADLREAGEILGRNLSVWRRSGARLLDVLTVVNNLALVSLAQADADRAADLFSEVLDALASMDHVEMQVMQTTANLAAALVDRDPDRAWLLRGEALDLADDIGLPDGHPTKHLLLRELGWRAHDQGDLAEAAELLARVVPVLADRQGERDPATTIAAWRLYDASVGAHATRTAAETRRLYLDWLTEAPEEELTPEQVRIRDDVWRRSPGDSRR